MGQIEKSLLNRISSSNAVALVQNVLSERQKFSLPSYKTELLAALSHSTEVHPVNLIGMTAVLHFFKTIEPITVHIREDLSPQLNKNENLFVCLLFMFDLLDESEMLDYLDVLFAAILERPEGAQHLNVLLDVCYRKFSQLHPSILTRLYELYSKIDVSSLTDLRMKFLFKDLRDRFDNKFKRTYPYAKDIELLLGNTLNIPEATSREMARQKGSSMAKFLNTKLRRDIFECISKSISVVDCYKRLLECSFSNVQYGEVFVVLAYCAHKERPYNAFYASVAQTILSKHPKKYGKLLRNALHRMREIVGDGAGDNLAAFSRDCAPGL